MYRRTALSALTVAHFMVGSLVHACEADELTRQIKTGQCEPAIGILRDRATRGEVEFQKHWGAATFSGNCTQKHLPDAHDWFKKAAEQSQSDAQWELGFTCDRGSGVVKDDRLAVAWYRKAAAQGQANGQNNLGTMYEFGHGLRQDAAAKQRFQAQQKFNPMSSQFGRDSGKC